MQENTKRNILLCAAAKGSFWTRLSFFIMGTGCIRYKQYVRGLIYLLTQIGFFCFLKNFALQYLSKFTTLGAETQRKVWNEDLQIYQRFPGDNSMLILLYSVLSLAVIAVFLYIWYANIRDSWHAQENLREGRKIASFRDDLHSLTNERFHITLLSMPMLTLVLFTLLPIIFMILIAFTNFDADHQPPGNLFTWVGMTNVTDIFLGNEIKTNTFFGLLGWTIVWAILATFTNYILGMLLAVAINSKLVKLKQVWRTCFCGSGECVAAGAGTDQRAAALPAGPDAGANCSRCGEYVDRHSLHHDDLFRGTDEHPRRAVRKRGNGRRGAGQKVHFHHAALYVLRDGPRDDHYLRDEFQQLQRHIPAHCRRPLLAGLLSGR